MVAGKGFPNFVSKGKPKISLRYESTLMQIRFACLVCRISLSERMWRFGITWLRVDTFC